MLSAVLPTSGLRGIAGLALPLVICSELTVRFVIGGADVRWALSQSECTEVCGRSERAAVSACAGSVLGACRGACCRGVVRHSRSVLRFEHASTCSIGYSGVQIAAKHSGNTSIGACCGPRVPPVQWATGSALWPERAAVPGMHFRWEC